MNIYVGNLPYVLCTEDQIRELFSEFGEVTSVKIIMDRETERPKGFAFVDMSDDAAQKAIDELDQKLMKDSNDRERKIVVNKARPREERPQRREHSSRY